MTLTQEAVKKLLRVKERILAEPERYDQDRYVNPDICGTSCCIAGWVVRNDVSPSRWKAILKEEEVRNRFEWWEYACKGLGIHKYHATGLFCVAEHWPEPFRSQFDSAITPAERAAAGAARIDAFIAKHTKVSA